MKNTLTVQSDTVVTAGEGSHRNGLGWWLSVAAVVLITGCAGAPPVALQGELPACPLAPRCVSSEANTTSHQRVAPAPLGDRSVAQARAALVQVIESMGGKVEANTDNYVAASFSSTVMGFTDDLTCRIDADAGVIHLRSESRLGFYDLGVNRRRVTQVRERLSAL